jgi:hypothetical protein
MLIMAARRQTKHRAWSTKNHPPRKSWRSGNPQSAVRPTHRLISRLSLSTVPVSRPASLAVLSAARRRRQEAQARPCPRHVRTTPALFVNMPSRFNVSLARPSPGFTRATIISRSLCGVYGYADSAARRSGRRGFLVYVTHPPTGEPMVRYGWSSPAVKNGKGARAGPVTQKWRRKMLLRLFVRSDELFGRLSACSSGVFEMLSFQDDPGRHPTGHRKACARGSPQAAPVVGGDRGWTGGAGDNGVEAGSASGTRRR